jgi:hypothetical protein
MSSPDSRGLQALTHQPLRLAPNRVYRQYSGGALPETMRGAPHPIGDALL